MMSRPKWKVLLICLALLVFATPAIAGGWATVTLDEMPGEVRSGETVKLSFVVRQHGKTPVHFLAAFESAPVEPYLEARNLDTGETMRVAAERGKEAGHFTLAAVFPSEGEWEWRIAPHPLGGVTEFKSLSVLPPAVKVNASTLISPPVAPNALFGQGSIQIAGAILIAIGLATLAVAFLARRRRMATRRLNN